MTCTKLILWRSASRNTYDACIRIGGGSLPTNNCRSSCVSLCGCAIACTLHASRSSRCLHVTKSLSETATLCHLVPFLKVEVNQLKMRLFHHALICQWLRKACHEYKNSGMHVAARHIDRYKDSPSRTLPRQTSQLKPIHSHSSRPLSWFPMRRVSRNEGSPGGRWPAHWFRAEEFYSKSETHRALVSIFLFTSTIGPWQLSFQSLFIMNR
jgi:hypothetical protein